MTPRGYALLTKMVKDLANELCDGRLALTLEGKQNNIKKSPYSYNHRWVRASAFSIFLCCECCSAITFKHIA